MKTDKDPYPSVAFTCMDKVLRGDTFIPISFNVKAFTQVNSQRMWMNLNTLPSSSHANCVIQINVYSS